MSDLIDRQAAIDALGDKPLAWTEGEYELGLQNQWQSDVDALKALPSAQPEQWWIPVTERLPEEAQECWIATKDGTVGQGMFTKRYGERRDSGFICYGCGFAWLNAVVAWMPYQLPEPYQEGR